MNDDPFAFVDDHTAVRPSSSRVQDSANARSTGHSGQALESLPALGGINPLEKAASRLLPLLITLKHSTSHPDPEQLRSFLINEIDDFKQAAQRILNDPKKVTQASYIMCTALDEAAMNTPWGHQTNWAQHNLLTTFHNEVIGGERFFLLLKGLGKNPQQNIELLELMYVCLSLGYEGNYRIARNGQNTLVKVRTWLHEIIHSVRSSPHSALSVQWQGTGVKESKLPRSTILMVVGAAALALTSIVFIGYRFSLGSQSDNVIARIFNIKPAALTVSSIVPPIAPPASSSVGVERISLEQLLQAQIDLGLVEVTDSFNEGKVRILGNNLFASGRTDLNTGLETLLESIANAMDEFSGAVLVTGHSDNVPIRSGRFASNLELSRARAESVAKSMGMYLDDSTRVTAEGRGSLEPIANNSTASGRAINRRVEVSIFY